MPVIVAWQEYPDGQLLIVLKKQVWGCLDRESLKMAFPAGHKAEERKPGQIVNRRAQGLIQLLYHRY